MRIAHKITELDHISAYFVNKTKWLFFPLWDLKRKWIQLRVCVRMHVWAHAHDFGTPLYVCVAQECI